MKKNALIIIILISFCSFSGLAQNKFYPIETGMSLLYQYDEMYATTGDKQSMMKVLDDKESINGKEYFVVQNLMGNEGDFSVVTTNYIRQADNGTVYSLDKSKTNEAMVFPAAPYKVGQSWKNNQMGFEVSSTIVATDATLETPVKTFTDCMVIENKQGNTVVRSYVQKGVGMVGIAVVMNGKEQIMQYLVE